MDDRLTSVTLWSRFQCNRDSSWSVTSNSKEPLVYVGSNSHQVSCWNLDSNEPNTTIKRFCQHDHNVPSIDLSPCGQFLMTVGIDETLRVWHLKTGKEVLRRDLVGWGWSCLWCSKSSILLYHEPTRLDWIFRYYRSNHVQVPNNQLNADKKMELDPSDSDHLASSSHDEQQLDLLHHDVISNLLSNIKKREIEGSRQSTGRTELDEEFDQQSQNSDTDRDFEGQDYQFLFELTFRDMDDSFNASIGNTIFFPPPIDNVHTKAGDLSLSNNEPANQPFRGKLSDSKVLPLSESQPHSPNQRISEMMPVDSTLSIELPSDMLAIYGTANSLGLLDHKFDLLCSIHRLTCPISSIFSRDMQRISILLYIPELSLIIASNQGNISVVLLTLRYNIQLAKYEIIPECSLDDRTLPIVGVTYRKLVTNKDGPSKVIYRLYILHHMGKIKVYNIIVR